MTNYRIPTAAELEADASAAGLSITALSERAGVAHSSYYRWRAGNAVPSIDTMNKWLAAIAAARRETSQSTPTKKG